MTGWRASPSPQPSPHASEPRHRQSRDRRDETLGPLLLCVASFLPFHTTYYRNGHHFMERELPRRGVRYRKNDNSFLATADPAALQAAADRLNAK